VLKVLPEVENQWGRALKSESCGNGWRKKELAGALSVGEGGGNALTGRAARDIDRPRGRSRQADEGFWRAGVVDKTRFELVGEPLAGSGRARVAAGRPCRRSRRTGVAAVVVPGGGGGGGGATRVEKTPSGRRTLFGARWTLGGPRLPARHSNDRANRPYGAENSALIRRSIDVNAPRKRIDQRWIFVGAWAYSSKHEVRTPFSVPGAPA